MVLYHHSLSGRVTNVCELSDSVKRMKHQISEFDTFGVKGSPWNMWHWSSRNIVSSSVVGWSYVEAQQCICGSTALAKASQHALTCLLWLVALTEQVWTHWLTYVMIAGVLFFVGALAASGLRSTLVLVFAWIQRTLLEVSPGAD